MGKHSDNSKFRKKKEKKKVTASEEFTPDFSTDEEIIPKDTKVKKAKAPKQNKKSKNRIATSYENIPIDDYTEKEIKLDKKFYKKLIFTCVIIIVLVVAVIIFLNRDSLTYDNISAWITETVMGSSEGEGYPVNIKGTKVSKSNFKLVDGRPCYVSDTSYVELSDTAGDCVDAQLSYDNPVMKGGSNYSIVYGVGSKGYMICNSLEKKTKKDTENGVFSADINDKGYYCVVTEGSGYLSELTAFNSENNKIYSYMFSDFYITCVSINKTGTGAVCCGLTTENGNEKTRIYFLDFSQEKPKKEIDIDGSVIYDCYSISSSKAIAVGDDGVFTVDYNSDKPAKYEYDTSILTTYSFNSDTKSLVVSLSRSGDGRNCDVLVFDSNGEKESAISTDLRVDAVSTYKGTIGILSKGQAYILDEDGTLSEGSDTGSDAQNLVLYSSSDAYILGISEIREIEID